MPTSVFSVALRAIEEVDAGTLAAQFAALPSPPPAPAREDAPAACCCSTTPGLDKAFVQDPTLPNANSYAVFQGLPPPAAFWSAAIEAGTSAVVVLGHDAAHVNSFFKTASGHGDPKQTCIALPDGRTLKCVHEVTHPEAGLVVRQLEVAGPSGQGYMWINFLWLGSWPDFGVPPSPAGLLRLCRELESCRRPGARIAVQCCCGTDEALGACPAGAFIATDMLRHRLQRLSLAPLGSLRPEQVTEALDVEALVRSLRAQRKGLVETAAQYRFVYTAIADEIKDGLRIERRLLPRGASTGAFAAAEPAAAAAR
ncbi:hypothetical protein Rsub_01838 [Raphidocelis subcapitata]|uniref:Tyrosine-protein phosphatase domain-containing protein n=1 Tax=Raphidocelis subcapitata TaxID=307507 RepID=A0A2V0NNH1_9CHLO|nr:hypothetical protein Rsub_01838 [Raphidocelis subcapitata]|eukprot:GBF89121.1 hypothetical protein Rsub_01838 [Raphidocelis subcapitata]